MSEINDIKEIPEGDFPINLTLLKYYKRKKLILMSKYKDGAYHKSSFSGVIDIYLNLITCEDKIVILSILQSYVSHW